MRPIVRAASRLPYIREYRGRLQQLTERCDALTHQRDTLEAERDQLAAHCRKLRQELENALRQSVSAQDYVLRKMRADWDDRARVDAAYYTNSANPRWTDADYFATGEANVREQIETDMINICQGDDPKRMRVLEIGCGAGRMTKALARLFGEVHAVDISAEMIRIAKQNLAGVPNAFFYQNNGADLQVLPSEPFDFAFSYIVFQHIPSAEVIESYIREVARLLKPGRLFKFQVQGYRPEEIKPADTWLGADFTVDDMGAIASRCGFEMRYSTGAGTQYLWLWFFRNS